MLVPQLARLLLAGLPLATPLPAPTVAPAPPPGAAGRVAVWTDRESPYARGEAARVYLRLDAPSYVAVFRVDTDGRIRVLFPREPWGDARLRERHELELTARRGGEDFRVDDDPGVGYLFAVASDEPLDFRPITRGDAWDYRLIDGGRIQGDPYVALTDLAARLSPAGEYDYDVTPYYVGRHYDYPRFVCYDCHAYAAYDEWNPYAASCTRYRVVVRDDPGYYPYRYGGRNVVTARPAHPGPRYVLRETVAAPHATEVTEPWRRREPAGRGREAAPAPGVAAPAQPRDPARPRAESPPVRPDDSRAAPAGRRPTAGPPPRSTGEPELRRRRP